MCGDNAEVKTWQPRVTVRAVQPVIAALEAIGCATKTLLERAGISTAVLTDPDGRVSHRAMMAFWERACQATGDEHLGLHLAEAVSIDAFEVHAYALRASPSLRDAFRRGCRYQRLLHEGTNLRFEEGSLGGVLDHTTQAGLAVPRHPAEFLMVVWLRLGRLVTDTTWWPDRVCFAHPAPQNTAEHFRVLGGSVEFNAGATSLQVSNTVLDLPNPHADQGLAALLDRYAQSMLNRVPQHVTLSDRVRSQLEQSMTGSPITATKVAQVLNLSPRSLHRGLVAENTSFRAMLDQIRHRRAVALLHNAQCGIDEVAFLLGFAELSSFYRAFRRWTGLTPARFRAALVRGQTQVDQTTQVN
jgi:AraC-like DNA-binding protein